MADKDVMQIKIGGIGIGIVGLKHTMEEMSGTYADKTDDVVRSFMLDQLGRGNYIPNSAKEEYGKAFVREFRKFLGQPYTKETPEGLDIKVLGTGCNQCDSLERMVMEVLEEINLPAGVDHVTDIKEIAQYGIMGSPALLINGKAVSVGSVPPKARIKKWLLEANQSLGVKS